MLDVDVTPVTAALLQERMVALVRSFGLHRPGQTPCGQPLSVTEAHSLMVLACESCSTQQQLAERLCLEKSTVSRLVGQLERRGWLERQANADDRRANHLQLTAAGARAATSLFAAQQVRYERLIHAIPVDQRAEVLASLDILVEAMRAAP